jgi:excisionase family DNA binding protein
MTKEEAAEALGVSTRSVDRYAAQGLLTLKYKKGVRGKVADFSEREVRKLKRQLSAGEAPKRGAVPKTLTAPFYHKLTLSVEEAAALAGLSKAFLEQAIEEGTLKVMKKDGKLNIKRKDLEQFVEKL